MKRPAEDQEPHAETEATTISNKKDEMSSSSEPARDAAPDAKDEPAEVKLTKKQKRDLNKPTMLPSVGLDQEVDLKVSCKDCKKEFVLSAKEQQVFRYRGYAHVPSRCPPCKKKKAARDRKNDNRKNRKNLCFAFKQGKCRRAENCRFKHGDEQENGITTGSNAGRLGMAMPMDMTLEAPPEGCCFDFWRTDDCSRGYNCKFEHRRGVRTAPTFSDGAAFGGPSAYQQAPVHDVGEPPMGVCFDFWKTQDCSRGDNCKFEHRAAPPPPVGGVAVVQQIGDPPMGVCFDFWKTGRCERNDNCRFEHKRGEAVVAPRVMAAASASAMPVAADVGEPPKGVCFDFFKTGQCSRDDNCKFEHRRAPAPVVAAPRAAPVVSAPAVAAVAIGDPPKGVCFDFFKTGECSRNDNCKFEHKRPAVAATPVAVASGSSSARVSTEDPPKGVCFDYFKTMQCSRGDNCKFKHERP